MAWTKANARLFMGSLISIGFFALIGALVFIEIPENNADILKVLAGFIGGAVVTTVSFYFGDSEGK